MKEHIDEIEHTQTPWSLDPVTSADIRGADGLDLAIAISKPMEGTLDIVAATVGPVTRAVAKANAAFIVEACNAHASLVEQRDRLREYAQHKPGCGQRYSSTAGEWVAGRECTCGFDAALADKVSP